MSRLLKLGLLSWMEKTNGLAGLTLGNKVDLMYVILSNNYDTSRNKHTRQCLRTADAVCFDVDSTLIDEEGINKLAAHLGKGKEIAEITSRAMSGSLNFRDAIASRLDIIRPSRSSIESYIESHPPKLQEGADTLVDALHTRGTDVYLVSGGFHPMIAPVAIALGIDPLTNVYANTIFFNANDEYAGFDYNEPTSRSSGKSEVIQALKDEKGYKNVVMIGDGITDLEAKPPADAVIGFGGTIVRNNVKNKSDWFVYHMDEIREAL